MLTKASTLIIDGYGFAFRSFHIQPPLTYKDFPVGCIYGFTSMLLKLINDFQPQRAAVVFDHAGPTFRHEIYPEYKQHRPPVPEALKMQLPLLRDAASALNFKVLEAAGFEADDIIASLAKKANSKGDRAIIISSDKDLMQLVNDKVWMFDPVNQIYIKLDEVVKKFGVTPAQMLDYLSIVGDSADNVPGIKGLGPKAASSLLQEFGNLENIYANLDKLPENKRKELLVQGKNNAFLSAKLVKLHDELEVPWEDLVWTQPAGENIFDFLQKYGFKSLVPRAEKIFQLQQAHKYSQGDTNRTISTQIIDDSKKLNEIKENIDEQGVTGLIIKDNQVFLSYQSNIVYEFNLEGVFLDFVIDLLANESVIKITYDLKQMMYTLRHIGTFEFKACHDVMLMYYVLSAGNKQLNLADIISKIFDINCNGYVLNGNSCAFLPDLYSSLQQKLFQNKALYLYNQIDLPLTYTLFKIEKEGCIIDVDKMQELSNEFSKQLDVIEDKIISIAEKKFNIASAKQLGEVLFDHLKLPGAKKSGKSQSYVTDISTLSTLARQGYEIANLVIQWRHLAKLKNTYTDSLPLQINTKTGKLHTHFLQTSTTTGRLSSIEPNLQNIPIKTDEGLMIRKAFIAPKGYKLISGDYSQIELRVLAEVAKIESMQEAFRQNQDIHTITASEMFHIPRTQVTSELRRKAKAINFGIIYGISGYGLGQNLSIPTKEADTYIKSYFAKYPGIEEYCKTTKSFAYKHGFVQNFLGRKCFVPGINDRNFQIKSLAERAAINAPIQSLAADITKIALINLDKILEKEKFETKIILQIHDEILLIAPEHEVLKVAPVIKSCMEKAFNMPLFVDIKVGQNWSEMKGI
ncbi:DNA polymerase I [Candidatus Phycorickettsia trachydisci]|uniref:DNA polymerase I n=1 Tax=Candidatus Phycorickettsia trachydisci TaxID=2115978 RepID=A0A2P1P7I9_9RICK|nr:DNA polymerase I [Candidatus Phycorickettsia trachydisci]AVP87232.1 DNA polymerase I [Candidatus Phycorickettsia trachydisci]